MDRSLVFGTDAFGSLIPVARAAEAAGFHRLWTTEYLNRDAAVRALMLAQATSRINVATGIAYAFSRSPLAMAALAADVYMASAGRFALGLGAGTRGMRTRWYDSAFEHPAPRLAEYVRLLRATWSAGEAGLQFSGRFYNLDIPAFRSGHDSGQLSRLPVYGSGLNAIMLQHAASSCDGVALHPLAVEAGFRHNIVRPAIERGRQRRDASGSGGQPDGPKLASWLVTSIDDDREQARRRAQVNLAFYFCTPSYRTVVAGTGWERPIARLREEFLELGPDWARLADRVPDDLVDAITLSGTPAEVLAQVRSWERELAEDGIDEVVFQTVGVGLADAEVVANCQRIVDLLSPAVTSATNAADGARS